MYCKHCYRMMEDGADICPSCGKSQKDKVITKTMRVWIGVGVWFVCMAIFSLVGTVLKISSVFFTFISWGASVLLAVTIARADMPASKGSTPPSAPPKQAYAEPSIDEYMPAAPHLVPNKAEPDIGERHTVSDDKPMQSGVKSVTHKVTGIQYYMDNIMDLAVENSDYVMTKREIIDAAMVDERIWKYEFCAAKAELVPEPDNPHDPNAVKVMVDGLQVGYIKAGSCARVLKAINSGKIRGIGCTIGGGPYKVVHEDDDNDDWENTKYLMEKDETNFFVRLTVYEATD